MKIEIVFLGTASALPTAKRNHPALYLRYMGDRFLFDCGEGTQRQMAIAKLSFMRIDDIFISHLHGDHILGLPGVIQTCSARKRESPLMVYGPKGIRSVVKKAMEIGQFELTYDVKIKEIPPKGDVLLKTRDYHVRAFPVLHSDTCYGFVFEENETVNIDENKLRKLGLKPSPIYALIKAGKTVEIDGRKLKPEDYLRRERGLKICYVTDTRPCPPIVENAEYANILIHEASFAHDNLARARETMHSTAKEAASVARDARVDLLVLTHYSSRYDGTTKLREEAKKVFDNVICAEDFERFEI
jgi:ribonuclease Z